MYLNQFFQCLKKRRNLNSYMIKKNLPIGNAVQFQQVVTTTQGISLNSNPKNNDYPVFELRNGNYFPPLLDIDQKGNIYTSGSLTCASGINANNLSVTDLTVSNQAYLHNASITNGTITNGTITTAHLKDIEISHSLTVSDSLTVTNDIVRSKYLLSDGIETTTLVVHQSAQQQSNYDTIAVVSTDIGTLSSNGTISKAHATPSIGLVFGESSVNPTEQWRMAMLLDDNLQYVMAVQRYDSSASAWVTISKFTQN